VTDRIPFRIAVIFVGVALASLLAWVLTPRLAPFANSASLASVVPERFGDWREIALADAPIDPRAQNAGETDREAPYDDVLLRGYENSRGDVVLLALAYGRHQRQEVKIHRPELCYTAQGFQVLSRTPVDVSLAGIAAPAHGARMLVRGSDRFEAVSYWIRIGDEYSRSAWRTRSHIFSEGMRGRVVDGMLVRVSQILPGSDSATAARFAVQEGFLADLVRALPPRSRGLLIGTAT
jgi:EpsI family protein